MSSGLQVYLVCKLTKGFAAQLYEAGLSGGVAVIWVAVIVGKILTAILRHGLTFFFFFF